MSPFHSPQLRRAIATIENVIDQELLDNGNLLPPVRRLCARAGVSTQTMCNAITYLREHGVLHGARGHRIAVVQKEPKDSSDSQGAGSTHCNSTVPMKKWEHVKERITFDLLQGIYPQGAKLPSLKELGGRYGLSFKPMKRVLEDLCKESLLQHYGNGFTVRRQHTRHAYSRIVLVGIGNRSEGIILGKRDRDLVRALESECARQNMYLQIVYFYRLRDATVYVDREGTSFSHLVQGDDILGYIYLVIDIASLNSDIFHEMHMYGKPVAMMDEIGGWRMPRTLLSQHQCRVFTGTVTQKPGKITARYLLDCGHRSIAYFSHFHNLSWSQNRLQGLESVYAAAGFPDGVKPFCISSHAKKKGYFDTAYTRHKTDTLQHAYDQWKRGTTWHFPSQMDEQFEKTVTLSLIYGEIYYELEPLFDRSLQDPTISAWVCANDLIAVLATNYLRRKEVAVPKRISLVSFDNTMDATRYRLTSYDFNIQGNTSSIVNFILRPSAFSMQRSPRTISIDGFLVLRESCGNRSSTP